LIRHTIAPCVPVVALHMPCYVFNRTTAGMASPAPYYYALLQLAPGIPVLSTLSASTMPDALYAALALL
jgi:hypothetical protein